MTPPATTTMARRCQRRQEAHNNDSIETPPTIRRRQRRRQNADYNNGDEEPKPTESSTRRDTAGAEGDTATTTRGQRRRRESDNNDDKETPPRTKIRQQQRHDANDDNDDGEPNKTKPTEAKRQPKNAGMSRRTMQQLVAVVSADLDHLHLNQMKPIRRTQTMMAPMQSGHRCLGESLTRKNPYRRASVGRTCSSKPRFDHGHGGIASDGTGRCWSGDVDKRPHQKYGCDRNYYTGRETAASTTDATGTATCKSGRCIHASGSIQREQLLTNFWQ